MEIVRVSKSNRESISGISGVPIACRVRWKHDPSAINFVGMMSSF